MIQILTRIIIGKGKAYESAIDICKELAKQHAEVTFN